MSNWPILQEGGSLGATMEVALHQARTILIFGEINHSLAKDVTEKLLTLSMRSKDEIKIIINSQGGHVDLSYTIFDMIRFVDSIVKVKIIGTGLVASGGALIYIAPPISQRFCLPNTRFMLHQVLTAVEGTSSDIGIEAREIVRIKRQINVTFSRQTGQSMERIEKDTDRNFWMTADEAKQYGIVGQIVESESKIIF